MMKKARKVVMESSPSSSLSPLGEDARRRFRYRVLLQDYEELLRDNEAKKRKLQKTIEKKLKLTAEVKFLRRKYKSFSRNLSEETPCRLKKLPRNMSSPAVRLAQPQNYINNSDLPLQYKKQRAKEVETPSTHKMSSLSVQFAQPQNSTNNSGLPFLDRKQKAKEVETPSTSALFDLNEVSLPNAEEMEGIQPEWEPLKVDKLKRCSADEQVVAHDLNLYIFKDVANSSSHVNKRKISWQDQVALRV